MATRKVSSADRSALLILDMVNEFDFDDGARLCRQATAIAPRIRRLKARVKADGGRCVYVNDNFTHWQSDFRELVARAEAGPGAGIIQHLRPEADDSFVLKPRHSAFFQTPLLILLRQLRIGRVVLTGIAADACVLVSAFHAHMHEFETIVISDCIAAATAARKRAALTVLRHSGVTVRGSRSHA
jgi:nicotinamidase-related amidase